jgi:hypothetical protein
LNLNAADWTPTWLWLAVVASGLYHGVNPGMGWPLAVSAGLMEGRSRALVAALGALGAGHLLAMLLVILPFALLVALVDWQRQIQVAASLVVIGFGIFRLVNRAIRERWRGYDRHNWGFGLLPWPSPMARRSCSCRSISGFVGNPS